MGVLMPPSYPAEFRRRAVELANQRGETGARVTPIAQLARDLGIADWCLRVGVAVVKPREVLEVTCV